MWAYEKKLQYPVKIARPDPMLAKLIMSQLGGPHGELGAATRYLSQRYTAPTSEIKGLLTDIGTEELAHRSYQLKLMSQVSLILKILHVLQNIVW